MSDSRPPIFDDGGGLPDVDRSRRRTDPGRRRRDADADADDAAGLGPRERTVWDDAGDENWNSPNYLVRRALVIGGIALVLVVAAVMLFRLFIGGDDANDGSDLGSSEWSRVVTIDNALGTVVITDSNGDETERFRFGISPITDTELIGSRLVGVDSDGLAVVDLASDIDIDRNAITNVAIATADVLIRPSGTIQTVVAPDVSSERMVLVHGPSGDVIDTAGTAAIPGARYDVEFARADPTGRNVLVTDSGNFQSVLFSFDRDEPSFFRGLALAVSDELVVTAQNVGTNADVSVFDHDGVAGVTAQTTSVRAAMLGEDLVVLIGIDGEILGLGLDGGVVSDLGQLSIGTIEAGNVALRGDRLIVVGETGTAIVDAAGTIVAQLPDARPTTTGVDASAPNHGECLTVERPAAGDVAIIDLETGAVVAEAIADPEIFPSASGCIVVAPTPSGYTSITADGIVPVTDVGSVVAISPDGGTVATERLNRVELLPRLPADADQNDDQDDDPPTDVGRTGRSIYFADL